MWQQQTTTADVLKVISCSMSFLKIQSGVDSRGEAESRTACAARLQVLSSSLCRGSVIRDCQRKHPDPGKKSELRLPPTRIVSVAGIRLDHRKFVRPFKGIFCPDISEFESRMPSHAVGLPQVRSPMGNLRAQGD
jgi:hypothetical protein